MIRLIVCLGMLFGITCNSILAQDTIYIGMGDYYGVQASSSTPVLGQEVF